MGRGRHYDLNMTNTPLENLAQYDAVLIVTDHTSYDYRAIVEQSQTGDRYPERHQRHRVVEDRSLLRAMLASTP